MPMSNDDAQMMGKLSAGLEALSLSAQGLQAEVHDGRGERISIIQKLVGLEKSLTRMEADVGKVVHIVCDGNGQPSLVIRLAVLEEAQKQDRLRIQELLQQIDTTAQAKVISSGQIWTAIAGIIITALLALGAILAQLWKS